MYGDFYRHQAPGGRGEMLTAPPRSFCAALLVDMESLEHGSRWCSYPQPFFPFL